MSEWFLRDTGHPGKREREPRIPEAPRSVFIQRRYRQDYMWCDVSAIVLSCIIVEVSGMLLAGGVSAAGGVSSAFLPQLTAAKAMVSDKIASIANAKFFRIVLISPPLGSAASAFVP